MVNRALRNSYTDITDTYTYTYDTAGNILSETKTSGGTTTSKTYAYGNSNWRDLLTAVNGTAISYDSNGDLKTYYNGNKTYTNLTWQHGRQLTAITVNGATASYAYDMDGIRTQKLVDGVLHSYVTQNGKVVRESFPYGDTTIIMDFIYDEAGRPFCVSYSKNGGESYTNYFYAVNAQGDVEGIFRVIKNDETGKYEQKWYGRYVYDAWGNVTATTATGGNPSATSLVVRNPIRYRGYYYDTETGFYYLQSRYYDPVTHRFINADSLASTGQGILGTNMFAYCNNNPVMFSDHTGHILQPFCVALKDGGGSITIYESLDDALYNAGVQARLLTNRDDREYICGIYQKADGTYTIHSLDRGTHDSASISRVMAEAKCATSRQLIALLHSHPYCTGHIPNDFSYCDEYGNVYGDLGVALSTNLPLLLAAPNGELKVLYAECILHNGSYYVARYVDIIRDDLPVDNTIFYCNMEVNGV